MSEYVVMFPPFHCIAVCVNEPHVPAEEGQEQTSEKCSFTLERALDDPLPADPPDSNFAHSRVLPENS